MQTAAVALGSNVGDRLGFIRAGVQGIAALPDTRVCGLSGVVETAAVVQAGDGPGPDFLNAVVLIETGLCARELLRELLEIERRHGRERTREGRWGARTLDLDLLFVGGEVVNEPGLTLPHPRLHERRFVLEPLWRVAPDWEHPLLRESVGGMLSGLPARGSA